MNGPFEENNFIWQNSRRSRISWSEREYNSWTELNKTGSAWRNMRAVDSAVFPRRKRVSSPKWDRLIGESEKAKTEW